MRTARARSIGKSRKCDGFFAVVFFFLLQQNLLVHLKARAIWMWIGERRKRPVRVLTCNSRRQPRRHKHKMALTIGWHRWNTWCIRYIMPLCIRLPLRPEIRYFSPSSEDTRARRGVKTRNGRADTRVSMQRRSINRAKRIESQTQISIANGMEEEKRCVVFVWYVEGSRRREAKTQKDWE